MRIGAVLLLFPLAIVGGIAGGVRCETFEPTASIRIDSGCLLKGVGFQLVEATVRLGERLYRVRFYGISAGAQGYHASGKIYGLDSIDDIVGRYEPAGAGVFVSETGVEIAVSPPAPLARDHVYIDYLGSLYARHDQSVQFGPRQ